MAIMTATLYKQETAVSLLCSRLSQRADELDQTYANMKSASIEDKLSRWTASEDHIGDLVNDFRSLVRLAQVVCGSSGITLNQLEALQGNSGAIGAGAVDLMKKQRMEAFEFEAMKALTPSLPSQKLFEENSRYPVEKFNIDNIGELSYILPEKHGWLLVFSKPNYVKDQIVDYGIYKASELRGQAMSGLEFSHLTDKTKVKITKAISQAKAGTPDFLENLLYSKQSIPCIFLECLETSACSRQMSDQESTDRDVNGLRAIHPFPSEDLTRVECQQLSTIFVELSEDVPVVPQPPLSSGPFQSIANWDLRRAGETKVPTKVPGTIPTPISRNREGNISDQEN